MAAGNSPAQNSRIKSVPGSTENFHCKSGKTLIACAEHFESTWSVAARAAPDRRGDRKLMLPILGVLMFTLWLLDNASHRPAGSLIHLSSTLACIAFVAEFVRSRVSAIRESWAERQAEMVPTTTQAPRTLGSGLGRPSKCESLP
jgi:hypothetical protein